MALINMLSSSGLPAAPEAVLGISTNTPNTSSSSTTFYLSPGEADNINREASSFGSAYRLLPVHPILNGCDDFVAFKMVNTNELCLPDLSRSKMYRRRQAHRRRTHAAMRIQEAWKAHQLRKKEKAAITIQHAWIQIRYRPSENYLGSKIVSEAVNGLGLKFNQE